MYLKSIGMNREDFLELAVYDYVYALSTYKNTSLGKPYEVVHAEGKLVGICMALGLNYDIKDESIIFSLQSTNKKVAIFPFKPLKPL